MKKIIYHLISYLLLGTGIMSDIQAVTDTSEYNKPFYTVQISYAGTGAEFRLNDIPFYLENFEGQVDTEIPVGDKMIQGSNELSIIVFPYSEGDDHLTKWHPDARVEATLYVREKDEPKASRKLITHIKLYPGREPKVAAAESLVINDQDIPTLDYESKPRQFPNTNIPTQVVISRKTHPIKTPFPRWEWQDGQPIQGTPENYASLLEVYRKYYTIHQRKDLATLKAGYREIAEIQKIIYYYNDIEQAYETLNLDESWNSEEQELFSFIEGEQASFFKQKLEVFGNGKLATITNETSIQPIIYIVRKARISIKYELYFYKNANGQWVHIM